MNHTSTQYAQLLQQTASRCQHLPLLSFLNVMHYIAAHSINTRCSDWCVELQYGPVRLYQPLAGGPAEFTRPTDKHLLTYRVPRWPLPLLRALYGRLVGRWSGRGQTTHP